MKTQMVPKCSCGHPKDKSWHLACKDCWAFVPFALQQKVYRLYREARGSDQHMAKVLTGLLREVDPAIDPDHIAHLPSPSGEDSGTVPSDGN